MQVTAPRHGHITGKISLVSDKQDKKNEKEKNDKVEQARLVNTFLKKFL
jgi:hypothetical protein